MKTKFSDKDLMAFADGELKSGKKSMDILSCLVDKTPESEAIKKRLKVFTSTRTALLNTLLGEKK